MKVLIGMIDLQEAKRIRSILEDRGVALELLNRPETCGTGGCKPQVEIYALETDVPKIQEFFREEQARTFEGLEIRPDQHNAVFDASAESAQCPACGHVFSTRNKECPDCGLVFFNE